MIVEDFGEFTPTAVESADGRIADPARRWAVTTDDGQLLFVDTGDLSSPTSSAAPSSGKGDKKK
ncbi:hypothetical protein [Tsukamurella sp. 1534]|uniref:hypothetical protein n=1 Tax=Tsukamurella sp. 1534 TaxID=1151061 RepID=UPI00178C5738|nr:hypothetical protein [Tsukamurella sp. 1534]